MQNHQENCVVCSVFDDAEALKSFNTDEIKELNLERETSIYKKGDMIITEGSSPKGVYCIKRGTAKLFQVGFNGKEQILRFAKEGDIIGCRSILCNETFSASASAMEEMEICFIPEKYFVKVLEVNPKLSFDILNRIARELGEAGRKITLLAQKTVRERLAEILLLLERKLGVDADGFINISLTREEMANLIGTATESAIRLISEFKIDQLIEVDGRRIKVLNSQKLTKLGHVNVSLLD